MPRPRRSTAAIKRAEGQDRSARGQFAAAVVKDVEESQADSGWEGDDEWGGDGECGSDRSGALCWARLGNQSCLLPHADNWCPDEASDVDPEPAGLAGKEFAQRERWAAKKAAQRKRKPDAETAAAATQHKDITGFFKPAQSSARAPDLSGGSDAGSGSSSAGVASDVAASEASGAAGSDSSQAPAADGEKYHCGKGKRCPRADWGAVAQPLARARVAERSGALEAVGRECALLGEQRPGKQRRGEQGGRSRHGGQGWAVEG